jgi:hypothetical protein
MDSIRTHPGTVHAHWGYGKDDDISHLEDSGKTLMININEYFTDESGKTLIPFISSEMCSFAFYTVMILTGLVVVTWPWQGFVPFMREQRIPYSFPTAFIALVVISTYLNLRLGRGEIAINKQFTRPKAHQHFTPSEVAYPFGRYTLITFCLHIVFWLLPYFPILILVTAISGFSLLTFGKAVSIVFIATLLCRLFGFLMYLLWGNTSIVGYLFSRVFLAASIYVTGFLAPALNPVRVMFLLDLDSDKLVLSLRSAYAVYMLIMLASVSVLIILAGFLVRKKRKKEDAI